MENVDTDVSLKDPIKKEEEIVINTYSRVVKQVNEEICLTEPIK